MKVNGQLVRLKTNAGRQTIKGDFRELGWGQGNERQPQRLVGFAEELDDTVLFSRSLFDRPAGNDLLEELDDGLTRNRKGVTTLYRANRCRRAIAWRRRMPKRFSMACRSSIGGVFSDWMLVNMSGTRSSQVGRLGCRLH